VSPARDYNDCQIRRICVLVLVVDPSRKTVAVHRRSGPAQTLREADILDISDIVDSFACRVGEIFE